MFVCFFFFSHPFWLNSMFFAFATDLSHFKIDMSTMSVSISGSLATKNEHTKQNKTKPPHDLVCARLSLRFGNFFFIANTIWPTKTCWCFLQIFAVNNSIVNMNARKEFIPCLNKMTHFCTTFICIDWYDCTFEWLCAKQQW